MIRIWEIVGVDDTADGFLFVKAKGHKGIRNDHGVVVAIRSIFSMMSRWRNSPITFGRLACFAACSPARGPPNICAMWGYVARSILSQRSVDSEIEDEGTRRMFRHHTLNLIGLVLICSVLGAVAWAQDSASLPGLEGFSILPWDQMRLLDGPADRAHGLGSLAKCNFTFAGFPRVSDLPACEKLGLRAILYPDDALGLTKPQHLTDEQIDEAVRSLAEQTRNSPACVGYFIRDEPGATDFPYLGKIVASIRRQAPGKLAYINLFPSYATIGASGQSQLETNSYAEYLERYITEVKPQLLSYDNYMIQYSKDLRDRSMGSSYFRDLLEVRHVALEHELPFWNIVSCNQIRPEATPPSPANLLLQAWTTLAAGGHGVSWYKYEQPEYHYGPIDRVGGRTATWSYLQMVNRQLKVVGPILNGLRSMGVYFTMPAPLDNPPTLPGKLVEKLAADRPLMIGEFASHGQSVDHFVVVNLSLEQTTTVHLKDVHSLGVLEAYSPEDGHLAQCEADLDLPAGQGAVLKMTR